MQFIARPRHPPALRASPFAPVAVRSHLTFYAAACSFAMCTAPRLDVHFGARNRGVASPAFFCLRSCPGRGARTPAGEHGTDDCAVPGDRLGGAARA
eukprot:808698-Pleurochrysis_carterae.AAC.4